jgi:hypothetical protein
VQRNECLAWGYDSMPVGLASFQMCLRCPSSHAMPRAFIIIVRCSSFFRIRWLNLGRMAVARSPIPLSALTGRPCIHMHMHAHIHVHVHSFGLAALDSISASWSPRAGKGSRWRGQDLPVWPVSCFLTIMPCHAPIKIFGRGSASYTALTDSPVWYSLSASHSSSWALHGCIEVCHSVIQSYTVIQSYIDIGDLNTGSDAPIKIHARHLQSYIWCLALSTFCPPQHGLALSYIYNQLKQSDTIKHLNLIHMKYVGFIMLSISHHHHR